jgi:hypothetical protein
LTFFFSISNLQHVAFLAGALGADAVNSCSFAFGLTTPKAAIATARLLENVGVAGSFSHFLPPILR